MRILLVGAGGVGSAITAIAARREFVEWLVVADYDLTRAEKAVATVGDPRFMAVRVDATDYGVVQALLAEHRCGVLLNVTDPRFVFPLFRAALSAGVDYLDMAMPPVPAAPERPDEDTAAKLGDEQFALAGEWEAVGRLALVGMGVEPGLSDVFARHAVVQHLDDDRGVPEPAGGLGEGPGLVHHGTVQRGRGRLPRGHRPGGVRQRGARGGAPHAPLDRRPAGDLQVRAGRRVRRRPHDAAQARPGRDHPGTREGRCRRRTSSPRCCPTRRGWAS
jgi:hypothetical protein